VGKRIETEEGRDFRSRSKLENENFGDARYHSGGGILDSDHCEAETRK